MDVASVLDHNLLYGVLRPSTMTVEGRDGASAYPKE